MRIRKAELSTSNILTEALDKATTDLKVGGIALAVQVPDGIEVSLMIPKGIAVAPTKLVLLSGLRDAIDEELRLTQAAMEAAGKVVH